MSTWVALPLIGTINYSIPLSKNVSIGMGTFFGWGSWAYIDRAGIIPVASLSIGNSKINMTCTGGYGILSIYAVTEYRHLFSFACKAKTGRRASLVFDSFILPSSNPTTDGFAIFVPGIRLQGDNGTAFQFGIGSLFLDWDYIPAPIPLIQWFKKI